MSDLPGLLAELTSGDDTRAEAVVSSLAVHGAAAVEALLPLLGASDPESRWWATRALAAVDDPQAARGLVQSLDDPQASVRQCAALGLRQQPTPEAIPELTRALGDADRLTARLAGDALAAAGAGAIPALITALQSEHPSVRIEAARALARAPDHQAVPALFAALEDDSLLVQYWAEEALERLGLGMVYFEP